MHFLSLASIALVASGASAIVVPRSHVHHARHSAVKPDTYYEGYLEVRKFTRLRAVHFSEQHNRSTRRITPGTSLSTARASMASPFSMRAATLCW